MAASISQDRKSTRLNSSYGYISYAVFCLKKKNVMSSLDDLTIDRDERKLSDTNSTSGREVARILFLIWKIYFDLERESELFFFFNDTATTEIYTLSLHDALPI